MNNEELPEVNDSIVITLDESGIHRQTRCKRKPSHILDDYEKNLQEDEPPGWAEP